MNDSEDIKMYNITLIGTVHSDTGVCNSMALLKTLENLRPEVLFEEIPPSFFDYFYKYGTRSNLETDTIKRYMKNHRLVHIPVDYDEIPEFFFENDRRIHQKIEEHSHEYRQIIDLQTQYTRRYGLKYLNSNYCAELYRQLDKAIEQTLELLGDEELLEIRIVWNDLIETRERTMIENIYNYCSKHQFERGVFFVGAAHRESIIQIIQEYKESETGEINWNYNDYDGLL